MRACRLVYKYFCRIDMMMDTKETDILDYQNPTDDEDAWLTDDETPKVIPKPVQLKVQALEPMEVDLVTPTVVDPVTPKPTSLPPPSSPIPNAVLPPPSPKITPPLMTVAPPARVLTKSELFQYVDADGNRHFVCFNCKRVGHIHRVCPLKQIPVGVNGPPVPLMEIYFQGPPDTYALD